jgi:hypothetical protein
MSDRRYGAQVRSPRIADWMLLAGPPAFGQTSQLLDDVTLDGAVAFDTRPVLTVPEPRLGAAAAPFVPPPAPLPALEPAPPPLPLDAALVADAALEVPSMVADDEAPVDVPYPVRPALFWPELVPLLPAAPFGDRVRSWPSAGGATRIDNSKARRRTGLMAIATAPVGTTAASQHRSRGAATCTAG